MPDAISLVFEGLRDPEDFLDLLVAMGGLKHPDQWTDGQLQREPGTVCALLTLSRQTGSEPIARDIIHEAARKWNFLVDNHYGTVYTIDEFRAWEATDPPVLVRRKP